MNLEQRLSLSYYKTIATINESHKIYLVQHQETSRVYVKKILDVYSIDVYHNLQANPIPGTPRIIECFEDNDSLIVIEEYISGTPLQEMLDSNVLSKEQVIHYISELCKIVNVLHSQNPPIVHRDIKPSNIIITNNDSVVLLDFNAAKFTSEDNSKQSDTILIGTQGYAAPEQYGFQESSPKTDIYSIGILLKNMALTLPNACPSFDHIINKCTRMDPSKRYSSIDELRIAILRLSTKNFPNKTPVIQRLPFLPPGFRTITPWKMIVAGFVYWLIIYVCLTFDVQGSTPLTLGIERGMALLTFLGSILIMFNYLNIQKIMPLCKNPQKTVHTLGVVLLLLIFSSIMFTITIFTVSFLSGIK